MLGRTLVYFSLRGEDETSLGNAATVRAGHDPFISFNATFTTVFRGVPPFGALYILFMVVVSCGC